MSQERVHLRHQEPTPLERSRELVLVVPPLRSNVNFSRILRAAGCCGIPKVIACGNPRIDPDIARDAAETVELVVRRSLPPVLKALKAEAFHLVAVEQTSDSASLHAFPFRRRTALIVGHERLGVSAECLRLVDAAVEIPVYGRPLSYNVATAVAMALYEYCRQYPRG